jgi:hypothetical protein
MGQSKREYMNYYSFTSLKDIVQKYNLDAEEQLLHETLCDKRLNNNKVIG